MSHFRVNGIKLLIYNAKLYFYFQQTNNFVKKFDIFAFFSTICPIFV